MNKAEALIQAKALVKKLKTGKWKPVVWENMGWHFKAVEEFGHMAIYANWWRNSWYYSPAYCPIKGGAGTPATFCTRVSYRDPNKAVQAQLKSLRTYLDYQQSLRQQVSRVFAGQGMVV